MSCTIQKVKRKFTNTHIKHTLTHTHSLSHTHTLSLSLSPAVTHTVTHNFIQTHVHSPVFALPKASNRGLTILMRSSSDVFPALHNSITCERMILVVSVFPAPDSPLCHTRKKPHTQGTSKWGKCNTMSGYTKTHVHVHRGHEHTKDTTAHNANTLCFLPHKHTAYNANSLSHVPHDKGLWTARSNHGLVGNLNQLVRMRWQHIFGKPRLQVCRLCLQWNLGVFRWLSWFIQIVWFKVLWQWFQNDSGLQYDVHGKKPGFINQEFKNRKTEKPKNRKGKKTKQWHSLQIIKHKIQISKHKKQQKQPHLMCVKWQTLVRVDCHKNVPNVCLFNGRGWCE